MSLVKQLLQEFSNKDYTPADVMSKVSSLGKKATVNDNVVKFGLQDSAGGIVMVYVDTQQAEEFEYAMSRALNDVEEMDRPEIAELLFNMHQQFNIVNVEWPQVVEDEEEDGIESDQTMTPEDGVEGEGDDIETEDPIEPSQPQTSVDATSALDAIIQMMAADSEAKRQEALARAAEAKAREAEAAAKIVDGKLRAEEEVADMEAFYDAKQQEQKEAKKLAKLAKYRHDVKDTETGEEIDDYTDALASQTANRDSGAPLDNELDGPESEMTSPAVDLDSKDIDMENEEADADGPDNIDRRFKEVEDVIRYLQSLPVQKASTNS